MMPIFRIAARGGIIKLDNLSLGGLVLKLDPLPNEVVGHVFGLTVGNDFEANEGSGLASNSFDDVTELHLHDVFNFSILSLGNANDLITRLDAADPFPPLLRGRLP